MHCGCLLLRYARKEEKKETTRTKPRSIAFCRLASSFREYKITAETKTYICLTYLSYISRKYRSCPIIDEKKIHFWDVFKE